MRSGALCSGLLVLLPQCNSYILGVHLPTRSLGVKSFMSTTAAAAADITQQKKHMREEVDARLQAMIDEDIDEKSVRICTRAYELAEQQSFTGAAIYLSMRKEVQSDTLAASLFRGGKRVFVPKIMGRAHNDLRMFEVCSMEQIAAFPKNKWNIPEPLKADVLASPDPIEHGGLDVVFMPGVAFDTRRARLGHGKAYYGVCSLRSAPSQ